MWMPPRHTENAAHAEPDPRSPWQAATALFLIAAFALLITGATQACAPRAATPLLSSTAEPDTGLTRTNPRLSEMIDALSKTDLHSANHLHGQKPTWQTETTCVDMPTPRP